MRGQLLGSGIQEAMGFFCIESEEDVKCDTHEVAFAPVNTVPDVWCEGNRFARYEGPVLVSTWCRCDGSRSLAKAAVEASLYPSLCDTHDDGPAPCEVVAVRSDSIRTVLAVDSYEHADWG